MSRSPWHHLQRKPRHWSWSFPAGDCLLSATRVRNSVLTASPPPEATMDHCHGRSVARASAIAVRDDRLLRELCYPRNDSSERPWLSSPSDDRMLSHTVRLVRHALRAHEHTLRCPALQEIGKLVGNRVLISLRNAQKKWQSVCRVLGGRYHTEQTQGAERLGKIVGFLHLIRTSGAT